MKPYLRKLKDQDAGAFDFLCNFALEHQYIDNSNPGKFIDKKFFKNLESDFFREFRFNIKLKGAHVQSVGTVISKNIKT